MDIMENKPEEAEELSGTVSSCEFLLEFFSKNTYNAWDTDPKVQHVMQRCLDLFGLDYKYSVVSNSSGELSTNYPSSLIILEDDKSHDETPSTPTTNGNLNLAPSASSSSSPLNNISTSNGDSQHISNNDISSTSTSSSMYEGFNPIIQELPKMKELILKSRYARCRARFPVPVILYNKKHICRSATLSGGPEIYGRTSFDYFFSGSSNSASTSGNNNVTNSVMESTIFQNEIATAEEVNGEAENQGDWQLFDRVRNQDIRLLKAFQVNTIIDLMVEKKKVKFGVNVTSSEKVDKKNRYANFKLISLPYPGCEFFRHYRDNDYNGEELVFEWNQTHVDANIFVPSDPVTDSLQLEWSQYKTWDLIRLTQNYLKLLLAYLRGQNSGLLIHCISGWDRTPLFVSLLRLSLWADGAVHQSLNAEQILFLTLAYDWLLFGHNLEDRLSKGEEILYFCFYFLTHIVDDEYSIDYENPHQSTNSETLSNVRNNPESDIPSSGSIETERAASLKDFHETNINSCDGSNDLQNGRDNTNGTSITSTSNGHEPSSATDSNINHDSINVKDGAPEINGITNGLSGQEEVLGSNAHSSQNPARTVESNYSQLNEVQVITNGNHPNGIESIPTQSERQNGDTDVCSEALENSSTLKAAESSPVPNSNGSLNGNMNGDDADKTDSTVKTNEGEAKSNDENVIPSSITETENTSLPESKKTTENGNSNDMLKPKSITKRSERLRLVRSHFYALYNTTIGSPTRHENENNGSGLSVIDIIATKVGIKTK